MAVKTFNPILQNATENIEADRVEQQRKVNEEAKYNLYQQAMTLNKQWNLGIAENTLYVNLLAENVSYANAKVYYDKVVKMAYEKQAKYSVPTNDYATLTPAQDNGNGNVLIWILLPIAALKIYKMFDNTNNKRKK